MMTLSLRLSFDLVRDLAKAVAGRTLARQRGHDVPRARGVMWGS